MVEGRLEVGWETGDARGKRSVVIDDLGLPKHLDELVTRIKVVPSRTNGVVCRCDAGCICQLYCVL